MPEAVPLDNRISLLQISNPKRHMDPDVAQSTQLFSYYAGYSDAFAKELISSFRLPSEARIFDPWNGSGTTTRIAGALGHRAVGMDLNPVMVVVAKAAGFPRSEWRSLTPLAKSILARAGGCTRPLESGDALLTWLNPRSAKIFRSIERQINGLVSVDNYRRLADAATVNEISGLAAVFYVALFRTVRAFLVDFIPSNPTWTKKPKSPRNRKNPSAASIFRAFSTEVQYCIDKMASHPHKELSLEILLGNAEEMVVANQSIDLIVTSPPYCTRIDYAVATAIELAVLGLTAREFDELRRSLTGTSTVYRDVPEAEEQWGATCLQFLRNLRQHQSTASSTYYLKNHTQYFRSLYRSMSEISRVLKVKGACILVAQTSHYKELLNDVPTMICEMAQALNLDLVRREDFEASKSMASLNMRAKRHLAIRKTTESVLCFRRSHF